MEDGAHPIHHLAATGPQADTAIKAWAQVLNLFRTIAPNLTLALAHLLSELRSGSGSWGVGGGGTSPWKHTETYKRGTR